MKAIKKTLALLLVLIMALSLCACGSKDSDSDSSKDKDSKTEANDKDGKEDEEETIVGTWEADIDFAKFLTEALTADEESAEYADYFEIDNCVLTLQLELNDDGTYEMTIDKDSAEEAAEVIREAFKECFESYFTDVMKESGTEGTVDELLESQGTSWDEFLDEYMGEDNENFVELFEDLADEGYYRAEDGKFYTYEDEDDFDEDVYEVYELKGDKLTLEEAVGSEDEENDLLYPMKFKRVK